LLALFSSFTLSARLLQGACVLAPGSGEVFFPGVFDEPIWIDHLYSFREMPVLVPSLILSIFAVCVTGVRADIYTRRHWDKQILTWQHWVEQILELDVGYVKTNIALTWMLLFINILLLVFSILGTEIALEVLLSLANGVLILYQVSCPVL
jgi:hypothetical protein